MKIKAYVTFEIPEPDWDNPEDDSYTEAQDKIEDVLYSTGFRIVDIEWK